MQLVFVSSSPKVSVDRKGHDICACMLSPPTHSSHLNDASIFPVLNVCWIGCNFIAITCLSRNQAKNAQLISLLFFMTKSICSACFCVVWWFSVYVFPHFHWPNFIKLNFFTRNILVNKSNWKVMRKSRESERKH